MIGLVWEFGGLGLGDSNLFDSFAKSSAWKQLRAEIRNHETSFTSETVKWFICFSSCCNWMMSHFFCLENH